MGSTSWPTELPGLLAAGLCSACATILSSYQIYLHGTNYVDATIQKYFIRIILLIPNYAICSFLSLMYSNASVYIETVRDMYEAFVIYSFMSLLLEYIGGPGNVETFCRDRTVKGSWLYGTCCLPTMQVDGQFVKLCKRLVLQFVIIKPISVVITLVLYARGYYNEDVWDERSAYMYLQILYNFCYGAALVGLIHFWAGTKELLKPYRPVWKFCTVKSVVFVTFWQGLVLSLWLADSALSPQTVQTWLLCVEMVPAAVMMWYAFPASLYMSAARSGDQGGLLMAVQNVGNVVMFTDVVTDLKHQFKPQYNTYTCYRDMDAEDHMTPSGQYRHATYIIRDPYQQQAIDSGRLSAADSNSVQQTRDSGLGEQ